MPTAVFVASIRGLQEVLEEHGTDSAVHLIQEFADITQEVIEELGGDLVHIWGDEAFILFRTPQQAVRAAVEAHRRYAAVAHPAGGSLGVGIGIAAGTVTRVITGHMGMPVKRAAQLCALAGSGQTLGDTDIREMIPQMHGVQFVDRTSFRPSDVFGYTEVVSTSGV